MDDTPDPLDLPIPAVAKKPKLSGMLQLAWGLASGMLAFIVSLVLGAAAVAID